MSDLLAAFRAHIAPDRDLEAALLVEIEETARVICDLKSACPTQHIVDAVAALTRHRDAMVHLELDIQAGNIDADEPDGAAIARRTVGGTLRNGGGTVTKEHALKLAATKFWEDMTHEQIAQFQLFEPLLCMPFGVFHEAVEKTLGRPVFLHEFGSAGKLEAELLGDGPAPTFDEIVALIPADKRIIIVA